MVEDVREIFTKKGDKMLFVKMVDFYDEIEVVVFPSVLEATKEFFEIENCIAVKGKFSCRNDEPSVIAEKVKRL